jgi:hypothetical protein
MSPKSVQRFWGNDMHQTRKKSGSFEPLFAAFKIETT